MQKRQYIIILLTFFAITFTNAQEPFVLGNTELVYSLPKTELVIDIVVEKVIEKPGRFYMYAQKYLGTTDVITKRKTYFQLKQIKISTRTQPDKNRIFRIFPKKKSYATKLAVNNQGILCGINVEPEVEREEHNQITFIDKTFQKKKQLPPLTEEYLLAGSTLKMAEGAAKQIFRIREARLDLLSGYVEELPKDGEAIKVLVEQMSLQEKQLTELFTGTQMIEVVEKTILFTPTRKVENLPLFRFSQYSGVVEADDLSGEPIYVTIKYPLIPTVEPEKRKKTKQQPIYTILPVKADIQFGFRNQNIYNNQLTIPQLGVLQPIPSDVLKRNSKVYIDTHTGRILSITEEK